MTLANIKCEMCGKLCDIDGTYDVLLLSSGGDPPMNRYAHKLCYFSRKPEEASSKKQDDYGRTKYLRQIHAHPSSGNQDPIQVDVYCVLAAFKVTDAPTAHAVKKLLCAGQRGKGDKVQDLKEALVAVQRAIELAEKER